MNLGRMVLTLLLGLVVGIVANVEADEITGFAKLPGPVGSTNSVSMISIATDPKLPTGTVTLTKTFTSFDQPVDLQFITTGAASHRYTFTETITNKIAQDALGNAQPFTGFHLEVGQLVKNKFVPDRGGLDIVGSSESTQFFGRRFINGDKNFLDLGHGELPNGSSMKLTFDLDVDLPSGANDFVLRETAQAPEPSTFLLLASGLAVLLLQRVFFFCRGMFPPVLSQMTE